MAQVSASQANVFQRYNSYTAMLPLQKNMAGLDSLSCSSPVRSLQEATGPFPFSAGLESHSFKISSKQGDCVEDACDHDECGDEEGPPNVQSSLLGVDVGSLLPLVLFFSTVGGGVCLICFQLPLINKLVGGYAFVLGIMIGISVCLYSVTLISMVYCALSDPGQVNVDPQRTGDAIPKRAHKTWLYSRPVRRYDHYCRWITNSIGLLNHREFLVMCIGLVLIAFLGMVVDAVALIPFLPGAKFSSGSSAGFIVVMLHLSYSMVLMTSAGQVLKTHYGLVSRNELGFEWKKHKFYVVKRAGKSDEKVAVGDISDVDEFNDLFDNFEYDASRNPYDRGAWNNCWRFWCTDRRSPTQIGDY